MAVARNGDVEIYYELFGSDADPTLVLISGLGSQCTRYDEAFCQRFVDRGLRVVRFDNRDVGYSTKFDEFRPDLMAVIQAVQASATPDVAYRLSDMANDVIGVLDAIGVERAHVAGWSLGGMIAQQVAIDHPDRIATMTSVMSTTGERAVGQSTEEANKLMLGPRATDRDSSIEARLRLERVIASPGHFDPDAVARETGAAFDRSFNPAGVSRQMSAIVASGSRAEGLRSLGVPTLVVHGDADLLVDASGGVRTAELVAGARFELIAGMGHDLVPFFWDVLVDLISEHVLAHC